VNRYEDGFGLWYDRQGNPITTAQWEAIRRQGREAILVARSNLGLRGVVSTVHLGLDYGFGDGPPVIFETMIFGGPMDQTIERYTTEALAREGHAFFVLYLDTMYPRSPRPLIHNGRKPK
jgi:hypothetical protein